MSADNVKYLLLNWADKLMLCGINYTVIGIFSHYLTIYIGEASYYYVILFILLNIFA